MTQEDKSLLLKDLCARLPYGIKFLRESWNFETDQELSVIEVLEDIDKDGYINNTKVYKVEDIKPYLFPLTSITEEQKMFLKQQNWCIAISTRGTVETTIEGIDWLNKNHFDYRGLIKRGLAIDATELNIY